MKILKFLVRVFIVCAVIGAFFGAPWCDLSLRPLDFVWGAVLTLLLGRFFCDALCPLGIVQTFVNQICHPKTHVRRVCSKLPETKVQRIIRWTIVALCLVLAAAGFMGLATMIFPLSIFGKALTLWIPGLVLFCLVIVLAAIGQGRVWCNVICPFGTIYNLLAKVSPCKNKIAAGCGNCRRCLGGLESSATSHAGCEMQASEGERSCSLSRRETLKGVAVLAVTEKLTDGGFAPVSLPGVPNRKTDVLPPGAGNRRIFSLKCVGCQLCVARCPGKCLMPSMKLSAFGQPVMDFRHGYCLTECARCSEVCPTGAIAFLQREQRPYVHLGHAIWKKDLCVRTTNGDPCTACVRKCPVQAIHLVKGFPVIDRGACLGCGACEHVCPARPMPAIFVKGYETQKIVNPISEADLVSEMNARIDAGAAVLVARHGVIIAVEEGRGLKPLMKLYDEGKLTGAIVVDKVIGRAAAAVCIAGGAKKVFTKMVGKGALPLLEAHHIPLTATTVVETILNREQNGSCPMEKAVEGLENPEQMVEAIRKAMKK